MKKRISVVMATYNGEKYIEKQLESILKQLDSNDEVIISDDCSTDNTIKIIEKFNDSRIRIVKHENNHGYTQNFENGLKYATGEYIFLSDQDDEWMDNKVEEVLEKLKKYDFVVTDCITVNENDVVLDASRFDFFNIKPGFFRIMLKNRYIGCCMAFNRDVLNAILPFPERYDLVEHDTWIATVAERFFKVKLINQPLLKYKRHGNNTSDGGFDKGYSIFNKVYRRLYRLKKLYELKKKLNRSKK